MLTLSQKTNYNQSHVVGVVDTLAQVFVGRVVSEPSELVLHSLGKCGIGDDRVLSLLIREIGIKVGDVQNRFLKVA